VGCLIKCILTAVAIISRITRMIKIPVSFIPETLTIIKNIEIRIVIHSVDIARILVFRGIPRPD